MKNKTVKTVLMLALTLGLATGCGSSKEEAQTNITAQTETAAQSETETPETSTEKITETETETESETMEETTQETLSAAELQSVESVNVETADNLTKAYQFELEGATYQLPCTVDDFLDNGCVVADEFLSHAIEGQDAAKIRIHPVSGENKYIEAIVVNESDQEQTVKECQKVVAISCTRTSNTELFINNHIKVTFDGTFAEYLKAIYSENGRIYNFEKQDDGSREWSWNFYRRLNPDLVNASSYNTLEKGKDIIKLSTKKDSGEFYMQNWPMQ